MALSEEQMAAEIVGPVVSVDDRDFTGDAVQTVAIGPSSSDNGGGLPLQVPQQQPQQPQGILRPSSHQIVTESTVARPGVIGASASLPYGKRAPPKFSRIINDYVGACVEEHCGIGKK